MNIFFVDRDPSVAAQCLVDRHVVKMILESAQILSTVVRKRYGRSLSTRADITLYEATHRNHPCVLWAGETSGNYEWLRTHAVALCDEFRFRYDGEHASERLIRRILSRCPFTYPSPMTEPPQAMPLEYRRPDPVEGYREYYRTGKAHLHRWTKREPPSWIGASECVS